MFVRPLLSDRPYLPSRPQRHHAVCADCGGSATLPFRPTQGRPVYCRECFKAHRSNTSSAGKAPASKRSTILDDRPTENAPDDIAVFPKMPLTAATRAAIRRMNIVEPTTDSGRSYPLSPGRTGLDRQARTGSGKTLAFAVPLVEQCDASLRQVQALVLVPTRELAIQVLE